jgi:hypothetical protein
VRLWVRVILLGILFCQASDLLAWVAPEPCPITDRDDFAHQDQRCPPTCARCACCAQATVMEAPFSLPEEPIARPTRRAATVPVRSAVPADILHVPRLSAL